jgi:hypothetical protein
VQPCSQSCMWTEGVPAPFLQWLCFDACPTYACMPYTAARAARLTPGAKIIVMLRDPADGLFSSETMIRNFGCDLAWSLAEPDQGKGDSRCGAGWLGVASRHGVSEAMIVTQQRD